MATSATLHLAGALAALAAGQARPEPAPADGPTFTRDIAPILYASCTECHRPGQAAPFPLITYADARQRARMLALAVETRLMPPWAPVRGYGDFVGARYLEPEQIAALRAWADAGAPEGDPAALPALPEFSDDWVLGQPDLELEMPHAFEVPADGPDVYRIFPLHAPVPAERWVRAVEIRPGTSGALHHLRVGYDDTLESHELEALDGRPGFEAMEGSTTARFGLGSYVVGSGPFVWPEGLAQSIPAGADILLDCHIHPVGKPVVERTRVGLYFTDEVPEYPSLRLSLPPNWGAYERIDIPPGERNYRVRHAFVLPVDTLIHIIKPHAHYICREIRLDALLPDGARRTLILIDDWRFEWQAAYRCAEPVELPAGTRLEAELVFDNSAENPANPHSPPRRVRFGLQSTDEMATIGLALTTVDPAEHRDLERAIRSMVREVTRGTGGEGQRDPMLAARLRLFDADEDGSVTAAEVPESNRPLFERADANGDGVVSAAELQELE